MRTAPNLRPPTAPRRTRDPTPNGPASRDEVLSGSGLSFAAAAKLLPSTRGGRPVHSATSWRWALQGVRLPDGRKLRLGAVKVSGHFATSRQALARFIDAQTPDLDADPCPGAAAARPPAQGQRGGRRANSAAAAANRGPAMNEHASLSERPRRLAHCLAVVALPQVRQGELVPDLRRRRLLLLPAGGDGAFKEQADSNGEVIYHHRLTPWPEDVWERPRFSTADGGGERADPDTLDLVYGKLLKCLSLSAGHAAALEKRGLKDGLQAAGYRTLGMGRGHAAHELVKQGLEKHLPTVPGFFVQDRGGRRYWTVAGSSGLLIPVRDVEGRVVALSIGRDKAGDGAGKYHWLTSKSENRGGPGPGSPIHVPLFNGDKTLVRRHRGRSRPTWPRS